MADNGVLYEVTLSYSPESNERAERLNGTLLDTARVFLREMRNI